MTDRIRIRMLETVRPIWVFAAPGFELIAGMEYDATSNPYGAISGICPDGKQLGVKPGEFVFLEAPDWVKSIWFDYFDEVIA